MKKAYWMAGFTVFAWGTMAPVSKLLLAGFRDMEVLGYGSGIGCLSLLAVILCKGEWRRLRAYSLRCILRLILLGTVGYFLYSLCYYHGLRLLPAQTACTLNYLWPIFSVLFSAVLLKEKLNKWVFASIALSFAGVAVMMVPSGEQALSGELEGIASCILAALLYGAFNVRNKKEGKSQLINMFIYLGTGAVWALLCCAPQGYTVPNTRQSIGLLWLGIVIDGLGFFLWAAALQCGSTAAIASLAYLTPVVSLLLSVGIFREPVHIASLIGLSMILCGFAFQIASQNRMRPGTGNPAP